MQLCGDPINSGGNGTSQKSVYADQETETYVHWHINSYIDVMTDNRITFEKSIAESRKLSLHPKKPVSTRNVVERFGRAESPADNVMCKTNQTSQDFLLDQVKHCPEAVIAIKSNSIGARLFSSQAKKYCPSLTPD